MYEFEKLGLKPRKVDKTGPLYLVEDVIDAVKNDIETSNYFARRSKNMNDDVKNAIEKTEAVIAGLEKSLNKLWKLEEDFSGKAKKVSSAVKDSEEKLAQGISRIEKAANFERLERYVTLIERAAIAMQALSELEHSGKLEKIASALK